jgi:hypothetical protein
MVRPGEHALYHLNYVEQNDFNLWYDIVKFHSAPLGAKV